MKKCFACVSILILSLSFSISQNNYYEETIVYNDGLEFGQLFGSEMTTNSEDLLVTSNGSIHFYSVIDGYWTEYQTVESEQNNTEFGFPVQLVGNVAYVGANNDGSGKVFIYEKVNDYWQQDGFIRTYDPHVHSFGKMFFIMEDIAIINARFSTTSEYFDVVYIFQNDGENWWQVDRIDIIDSNVGGLFINQETAFIGLPHLNGTSEGSGAVIIYTNNGNDWIEASYIEPSLPVLDGNFGKEICMVDDYLFISADGTLSSTNYGGIVYVYTYDITNGWVEYDLLVSSDSTDGDHFGAEIDAFNDNLVISAVGNRDGGYGSGSAYIFSINSMNNQWVETNKIIPSDLLTGDFFGGGCTISNNYVFISSPMKENLTGAVYIYDPNDTTLHSNFAGDVRNGNAPVTVQFTSVPQGNPTSYEWDFNSDGFVDSTEPHPEFTYNIDGTYTVTLTVFDETGSDAGIKEDYIQVISDILFGDVNLSGSLDVGDIVLYVDFVLGFSEPTEDQFLAGDVNYSGGIDIIDIVMVIDEILGL